MSLARNLSVVPKQTLGFKNRIINGAMVIDQRNAGASFTPTDNGYGLDRYRYSLSQASKFSAQQSSVAPTGFNFSYLHTVTSAVTVGSGDLFAVAQFIEGFNTADLAWGTANAQSISVSFWVRSSVTGTFNISVMNSAANRAYPATYTINSANTWEYKTITIAGDTSGTWVGATNGIGLRLYFNFGCGSTYSGTANTWNSSAAVAATGSTSLVATNGATFYITGVQLEVGSSATGFEYRQYGQELALCQRYYWQSFVTGSYGNTPVYPVLTSNANRVQLPISQVSMRTTPSATSYNASGTSGYLTEFSSATNVLMSSINPAYNGGGGYAQASTNFGNSIQVAVAYSAEL